MFFATLFHAPINNIQQEQWKWQKHRVIPRSYKNQRKNSNVSSNSQKIINIARKYRFSVVQNIHRLFGRISRISLKNPSNLSISYYSRSKIRKKCRFSTSIAQKTIKYCRNSCYIRQNSPFLHPNVTICVRRSKSPEYYETNEKTSTTSYNKAETTRKPWRKESEKEPRKEKEFFFLTIFLFTI